MPASKIPPPRDGLAASRLQLPPGPWCTVLETLSAQFPAIAPSVWRARFERGLVLDAEGQPLTAEAPHRAGMRVHYYRELPLEPQIPFTETIVYEDEHLLVADKPHFLPVMPAGAHAVETLLARLVRRTAHAQLAPLHRIDRDTAGLVLFSIRPESRDAYQAMFRERRIAKRYEAIAPALPQQTFPLLRRSRIERGEPFFRMREVAGAPNSETRIEVLEQGELRWRYALHPVTGRKHQLRVHMAALGAPIVDDPIYGDEATQGFDRPLRLLAKALRFVDPLSGADRHFESSWVLQH